MQDFSQRLIIVARKDLPGWQFANAVAHVSAFVGNKLGDSFGTGKYFTSKDKVNFPRNSQYPIIIKRAGSDEQLKNLFERVKVTNILHYVFIREMIDHTNDEDLQRALESKDVKDIEFLAVGVFGPNDEVSALTKKFGLWE
ncbi:MAG: hypothetical protein G01um10148_731 [Parcubacteria group bacterium Gr01-1014_8]|nr:MAG: hypothetical protein G01um10148_731 [Parcubacteria group bacterium Gr01-1014_8]